MMLSLQDQVRVAEVLGKVKDLYKLEADYMSEAAPPVMIRGFEQDYDVPLDSIPQHVFIGIMKELRLKASTINYMDLSEADQLLFSNVLRETPPDLLQTRYSSGRRHVYRFQSTEGKPGNVSLHSMPLETFNNFMKNHRETYKAPQFDRDVPADEHYNNLTSEQQAQVAERIGKMTTKEIDATIASPNADVYYDSGKRVRVVTIPNHVFMAEIQKRIPTTGLGPVVQQVLGKSDNKPSFDPYKDWPNTKHDPR